MNAVCDAAEAKPELVAVPVASAAEVAPPAGAEAAAVPFCVAAAAETPIRDGVVVQEVKPVVAALVTAAAVTRVDAVAFWAAAGEMPMSDGVVVQEEKDVTVTFVMDVVMVVEVVPIDSAAADAGTRVAERSDGVVEHDVVERLAALDEATAAGAVAPAATGIMVSDVTAELDAVLLYVATTVSAARTKRAVVNFILCCLLRSKRMWWES